MGKYDDAIRQRGLKRDWACDGNEKRRIAVDAEKQRIQDEDPAVYFTPSNAAARYIKARVARARLKAELKKVDLELEAMTHILVEVYESDKTKSVKITVPTPAGSVDVNVRTQSKPNAKATDYDMIRLWAVAEKLERDLRIPHPKLNAMSALRCLEGKPAIPGTELKFRTQVIPTGLKHVLGFEEDDENDADGE